MNTFHLVVSGDSTICNGFKASLWDTATLLLSLRSMPYRCRGVGSSPQGTGDDTLEILEIAGPPPFAKFSKCCSRPRGCGRHFENLRKRGDTVLINVFQIPRPAYWGGGRAPNANSIPSGRAPTYFRPTAMALTGSLTRREAVSSGLPEKGGVCCRIMKGRRVATPTRGPALQNKSGKGTARSKP